MAKVDVIALITGIILCFVGVVLAVCSFKMWFMIFYSIFCVGVGLAILLTMNEQNQIEQIKTYKKERSVNRK